MRRFGCNVPRPIGNGGRIDLDRTTAAGAGPDHEFRRCRCPCRRRCRGGGSSPAWGITRTLRAVGLYDWLSRTSRGWNGARPVRRRGQRVRMDGRFCVDRAWFRGCGAGDMVGARLRRRIQAGRMTESQGDGLSCVRRSVGCGHLTHTPHRQRSAAERRLRAFAEGTITGTCDIYRARHRRS